jgi:hypothetical protein
MSDTAIIQLEEATTALELGRPVITRTAAAKFSASYRVDKLIDRSIRASDQQRISRTGGNIAGAAKPQEALYTSYLPPRLLNRKERRRWEALKQFHPDSSALLNKWEGQVLECCADTFAARLFDLNARNVVEIAEFDMAEVGSNDRALVVPGGIFYWYILRREHAGNPAQSSLIWFRRGGKMSAETFQTEREKLDLIWDNFGWNGRPKRSA